MERFEMKSMLRVGNLKKFSLRKFSTLDYFSLTLRKDHVMGIPGTSSSTVEETIKGMWRALSVDQKIHYSRECTLKNIYLDEITDDPLYISGEKIKDETELEKLEVEKLKLNPYVVLPEAYRAHSSYSPSGTYNFMTLN